LLSKARLAHYLFLPIFTAAIKFSRHFLVSVMVMAILLLRFEDKGYDRYYTEKLSQSPRLVVLMEIISQQIISTNIKIELLRAGCDREFEMYEELLEIRHELQNLELAQLFARRQTEELARRVLGTEEKAKWMSIEKD
jgi:hypothetical protein